MDKEEIEHAAIATYEGVPLLLHLCMLSNPMDKDGLEEISNEEYVV
jgi:hypothetical protein